MNDKEDTRLDKHKEILDRLFVAVIEPNTEQEILGYNEQLHSALRFEREDIQNGQAEVEVGILSACLATFCLPCPELFSHSKPSMMILSVSSPPFIAILRSTQL